MESIRIRNYNRRRTDYPSSLRAKVTKYSWLDLTVQNLRAAGMLDYVNLIRARSPEASRPYADGQLTFVWVGGDHGFPAVLADLPAWWPKVKPGGFLGGHDFDQPQVKRALKTARLERAQFMESRKYFLLQKQDCSPETFPIVAAVHQPSIAAA